MHCLTVHPMPRVIGDSSGTHASVRPSLLLRGAVADDVSRGDARHDTWTQPRRVQHCCRGITMLISLKPCHQKVSPIKQLRSELHTSPSTHESLPPSVHPVQPPSLLHPRPRRLKPVLLGLTQTTYRKRIEAAPHSCCVCISRVCRFFSSFSSAFVAGMTSPSKRRDMDVMKL